MLGAIIGDIVGSVYEFQNIKRKEFPLFGEGCTFTDDTVMTVAVADAIMQGETITLEGGLDAHSGVYVTHDIFIDSMKKWGRLYPNSSYGARFSNWLFSDNREPYSSWGNGAAMHVSPCGWIIKLQQFSRIGIWGTLAAITGGIVEAAYGIPKEIADRALAYLDKPLREVFDRWCATIGNYRLFA